MENTISGNLVYVYYAQQNSILGSGEVIALLFLRFICLHKRGWKIQNGIVWLVCILMYTIEHLV